MTLRVNRWVMAAPTPLVAVRRMRLDLPLAVHGRGNGLPAEDRDPRRQVRGGGVGGHGLAAEDVQRAARSAERERAMPAAVIVTGNLVVTKPVVVSMTSTWFPPKGWRSR